MPGHHKQDLYYNILNLSTILFLIVPMDLDVKVKATVLGAAFLIVSIQLMVVLLMVCLKSWLVV